MENQINQLLQEVALASSILPPILMFIPRRWSEESKKGITFLASVLLTLAISSQHQDLALNFKDFVNSLGHLAIILTVASQVYDKAWKPAADTLASRTPLKFLRRSNKVV